LFLAIGVGYLAVAVSLTSRAERANQYAHAARHAFYGNEYQAARLYYDRLLQLGGGDSVSVYQLALALNETGDESRVAVLMDQLATIERPGYAPAHLWWAQNLLSSGNVAPRELRIAKIHLTHALRSEPKNQQVQTLLGQVCLADGDPDGAIEYLTEAARTNPEVCLMLAKAFAVKVDKTRAQEYGRRAQEALRRRSKTYPTDIKTLIALIDSTMFLEQFPEALQLVKRGLELFGKDEASIASLRQVAATTYIACYDWHERNGTAEPTQQFKLLAAGLNANPNEMLLFYRLMDALNRRDDAAGKATQFLTSMLARGEGTALVHLLLGTDAAERGELDRALKHLEQAQKTDPNMIVAANNFAWYLAHHDPPDLERALALVDAAIEGQPNFGPYRDTRGQILGKMGRWEEALIDLEAALPELRSNLKLHEALVQAYEQLGMSDLAAEHRNIAEQIRKSNANPN
jgi:tetratricopeptide (TPR) repeat protein